MTFVESSRNIPRDCLHMRTTKIYLNLADVTAAKKLTTLKSVPLMLEQNTFGCIVFELWVGQYSLCVFLYKETNSKERER